MIQIPLRTPVVAVFAILATLVVSPINARSNSIRGLVTDESDTALPNVLVELTCTQNGHVSVLANTKTTSDGRFKLDMTAPNACKIRITAPGFASTLIPIRGSEKRGIVDLGKIRMKITCSGPGVTCDEVTPKLSI
jgi:hypothetical protein